MKEELNRSYFHWALAQSRLEFAQGFPLLSKVRDPIVFKFLEFAEELYADERELASAALVKRFHSPPQEGVSQPISERERALIQRFMDFDCQIDQKGKMYVSAQGSKKEQEFWRRIEERNESRSVKGLSRALRLKLQSNLGGDLVSSSRGVLIYERRYVPWVLRTVIDINASAINLDYAHSIGLLGQPPMLPFISTCTWMGISSRTSWALFTEREVDAVAEEVACHLNWFAEQWISLIPK